MHLHRARQASIEPAAPVPATMQMPYAVSRVRRMRRRRWIPYALSGKQRTLSMGPGGNVRVAVIGCGYWGSKHVRVLQGISGVELVIAVDPSEERLAALQQTFPGLAVER